MSLGERDETRLPSLASILVVGLIALFAFSGLTALGVWQLHRRTRKLELIAAVDRRMHAAPVDAPGPRAWPSLDAGRDEYRRVTVVGHFLAGRQTLVQAVTDLGGGYWVMAPLRTDAGFTILVNRGFVPADHGALTDPGGSANAAPTVVTGLLRMTEPGGGFLRSNDPAADRWYSRDVAAIAQTDRLTDVAPYFIDADEVPGDPSGPVGGLTVVRFPNNHLVYALTWFGLAAMVAGAAAYFARDVRRAYRRQRDREAARPAFWRGAPTSRV